MSNNFSLNIRRLAAGLCAVLVLSGTFPAGTLRSGLIGAAPLVANADGSSEIGFVKAAGKSQINAESIALGTEAGARAWLAANRDTVRAEYVSSGASSLHICWREEGSQEVHYLNCDHLSDFDSDRIYNSTTSYAIMQDFTGDMGDLTYICIGAPADVFLAGDGNGWLSGEEWLPSAAANKMTANGGVYTISFSDVPAGEHSFVFTNGTWDDVFGNSTTDPVRLNTELTASDIGENIVFVLTESSDITITFDISTKKYIIASGNGKTDLSSAAVEVDTVNGRVTVKTGEGSGAVTVPSGEYTLSFEKKNGDTFTPIDLAGFPFEPGTYKVTVTAEEDSGSFFGSKTSEPFTVEEQNGIVFRQITDYEDVSEENISECTVDRALEWLNGNKESVRSVYEAVYNDNNEAYFWLCMKNSDGELVGIHFDSLESFDSGSYSNVEQLGSDGLKYELDLAGSVMYFCGGNMSSAVKKCSSIITEAENGTVTAFVDGAETERAEKDSSVTLSAEPSEGYRLISLSARRALTPEDIAEAIGNAVFENKDGGKIKVEEGEIKCCYDDLPVSKVIRTERDPDSGEYRLIFSDSDEELYAEIGLNDENKIVRLTVVDELPYICENGSDGLFPSETVELSVTGNSGTFTMPASDVTVTAEFEFVKIDLGTADVSVDTAGKDVTVTVGSGSSKTTVPREEYTVDYIREGESAGYSVFPTSSGSYTARVTARSDSEKYIGSKTGEPFAVEHSHVWAYEAGAGEAADTITAKCVGNGGCDIAEDKLTMKIAAPEDLIYDGKPKEAVLSVGDKTAFPGTYTVSYYDSGDIELFGAPIRAGTYTARVTVENAAAEIEFTIAPRPVTLRADSAEKTYDGTPLTAEGYTLDNGTLAEGESIESVAYEGSRTDAGSSENELVSAVIRNNSGDNVTGSYIITYVPGTLTVKKAVVTVIADAASKTYGGEDPVLTYKAEGLIGGDELTGKLSRESGENAGTYAISQGTLTAGDNYAISFTGADLTVKQAAVTITADDKSSKYGADIAELTYKISGSVKEGDDLGVKLSTEAASTSDAGEYPITVTWNGDPNYAVTLNNGKYTITKASLTVTAAGWSGTYDGKEHGITVDVGSSGAAVYYSNVELNSGNYSSDGSTTAPAYTDAGEHTVYYYAVSGNHEGVSGKATVSIDRAVVTVAADDAGKTYGKADPELTYKAEGLIGDDKLTGSLARSEGEDAGTYEITNKDLTAGDNYMLSFTGAVFTINKAAVTVTADNKSAEYGRDPVKLTYSITGEYKAGDDLGIVLGTEVSAVSGVGEYPITVAWNGNGNYTATLVDGIYTVTKAAPVVTAPTPTLAGASGKAVALVNGGKAKGGTLWYALGYNNRTAPVSGWSTKVPTASESGTYCVWYKVIGDENHSDTEPACVVVKLGKSRIQKIKEARDVKVELTEVWSDRYGTLSAAWTSDAEADGFEVLIWNSRRMGGRVYVSRFDAGGENEITVSGLVPFEHYHIRVRAYRTIEGRRVYGRFSMAVSAEVKGFFPFPGFGFMPVPGYGCGFAPWNGYGYHDPGYGRPHLAPSRYRPATEPFYFYRF